MIKLNNVGEEPLTWVLDCAGVERLEDGTLKFVHPTGRPLTPPIPSSSQPTEGEIGFLKPGRSFEFTVQCKPGTIQRHLHNVNLLCRKAVTIVMPV